MAKGFLSSMQQLAREVERQQAQQRREAAKAQRQRELTAKRAIREEEARKRRDAVDSKAACISERIDEVDSLNAELEKCNSEIENLLSSSIGTENYFDLACLHREAEHPPFGQQYLEQPTKKPLLVEDPPKPEYLEPKPPNTIFGKRKKHEAKISLAKETHEVVLGDWQKQLDDNAKLRQKRLEEYDKAEKIRLEKLETAKMQYASECSDREKEVKEFNSGIDNLITNLSYGSSEAVEAYYEIVFSNSEYPEHFPVSHEVKFEPSNAELVVRIIIPSPSEIQTVKEYRYVRKNDEITSAELSMKAKKERYASAIHQVLLRTFNEIYKADRRGLVKTASLELGTETKNPATGKQGFIPLAGVAAAREAFLEFNLSEVVPKSTLDFLGASISKSPLDLAAADTSGVRHS